MLTFCFTRQDNITGDNFVHRISSNFQAGLKATLSIKQIMLNSIFLHLLCLIRSTLGKQCRIQIVFICCHTMSYTNFVYLLPYVFLFYDKETKTLLYINVYKNISVANIILIVVVL